MQIFEEILKCMQCVDLLSSKNEKPNKLACGTIIFFPCHENS
jgi:hypothetical protein